MNSNFEHLIVGTRVLGLALADHLLRRGAERVALLDSGTVAPAARAVDDPGLLIRTGRTSYQPWEERSFLLLQEWQTYLGCDPHYLRCGSLTTGGEGENDWRGEPLDSAQMSQRFPGLQIPKTWRGHFDAHEGVLDSVALVSALYSRVRDQGGEVLFNGELQSVEHRQGGGGVEGPADYRFTTHSRQGRAQRLYLTDELSGLRALQQLQIPFSAHIETWHSFSLAPHSLPRLSQRRSTEPEGSEAHNLYRFLDARCSQGEESSDLGGLLEEFDESPTETDRETTTLVLEGRDEVRLLVLGGPSSIQGDTPVDWRLLENSRQQWGGLCPPLAGKVRRGHTLTRLALANVPTLVSAHDERLQMAGSFGIHTTLLSLSWAEHMAEVGLGLEPTTEPPGLDRS